jgi:two-component system chemotaxis sensor kinase CheA
MTIATTNEAFREELVTVFVAEAEEILDRFEQLLLALEQRPDDEELLNEIFRAAHTLKGNAACLQFDGMTHFAHVLEELLDGMREGKIEASAVRISQLLDGVDALRGLVARSIAGNGALTANDQALLDEISNVHQNSARTSGQPGAAVLHSESRTLRVATTKFDRMLDLAGEIAVARGLVWKTFASQCTDEHAFDALRELDRLSFDLQEAIMSVRLLPVGPAFRHFHRVVRDLAASQNKSVRLVLDGDDVEVDNTMIDRLKDPITHMIRNAIDHGIESPNARVAAGKDATGVVSLAAAHEAGGIVIRFSDDGAGLNAARIAERARQIGLNPDRMTRAEVLELIFEPGFSTAAAVTDLSGRGVGMDVVRRNIESLGGNVAIESQEGAGTQFTIRLPLTLAVIEGFGVSVAKETYVIPMEHMLECMELPADHDRAARTGILFIRGEVVPYVRLRALFELGHFENGQRENVVILQHDGKRAGVVVDGLHGASQAVIKPLGFYFTEVPGVAGSSILGDGRVALILDTPSIFRELAHEAAAAGSAS